MCFEAFFSFFFVVPSFSLRCVFFTHTYYDAYYDMILLVAFKMYVIRQPPTARPSTSFSRFLLFFARQQCCSPRLHPFNNAMYRNTHYLPLISSRLSPERDLFFRRQCSFSLRLLIPRLLPVHCRNDISL